MAATVNWNLAGDIWGLTAAIYLVVMMVAAVCYDRIRDSRRVAVAVGCRCGCHSWSSLNVAACPDCGDGSCKRQDSRSHSTVAS